MGGPIWRLTTEEPLDGEIWRACGYDGYEVSNLGRLRCTFRQWSGNGRHMWPGKIITQNVSSTGYAKANFKTVDGQVNVRTHRLVAKAFVKGETPEKSDVNHIDAIKTNNVWTNLEWVTPKENVKHAEDMGLRWVWRGEDRKEAKLTEVEVWQILEMRHVEGKMYKEIAAKFPPMCPQYAQLIATGKRWPHVHARFMDKNNKEFSDGLEENCISS